MTVDSGREITHAILLIDSGELAAEGGRGGGGPWDGLPSLACDHAEP